MRVSQLAKQFWQDGFLVLPDFFDAHLMDRYNDLILEHFGLSPEFFHTPEFLEKASTEVIPWFPQREGVREFDAAANDPQLNHLTGQILGDGWYSDYCMVMFSRAGTKGQAWHQDCAPENPDQFNLNRLVYTMDIGDKTGGETVVVRGSHRKGTLPASALDQRFEDEIVLTPAKGTVVLLHGHTWHKVLPVHGEYRVSTNFRSAPKGTPEGITDVCVYQNMRYRFSTNSVIETRV